jgi:hypothetical protein
MSGALLSVVMLGIAISSAAANATGVPSVTLNKQDTGGIDRNYDRNYDISGWDRRFDRNFDRNYDTAGWDRRFDRNFNRNYDTGGWDRPPNHFLNTVGSAIERFDMDQCSDPSEVGRWSPAQRRPLFTSDYATLIAGEFVHANG